MLEQEQVFGQGWSLEIKEFAQLPLLSQIKKCLITENKTKITRILNGNQGQEKKPI